MNNRSSGTGIILLSLFVACVLEVLPLPQLVLLWRPEWLLLVLLYWILEVPQRIGVLWGFGAGLALDFLTSVTLGQWALAFSLGAWAMIAARKRMKVFSPFQQSAVVFLIAGTVSLAAFSVQESVGRTFLPPYTIVLSAFVSALLWVPVCALLREVQARFLVR